MVRCWDLTPGPEKIGERPVCHRFVVTGLSRAQGWGTRRHQRFISLLHSVMRALALRGYQFGNCIRAFPITQGVERRSKE